MNVILNILASIWNYIFGALQFAWQLLWNFGQTNPAWALLIIFFVIVFVVAIGSRRTI